MATVPADLVEFLESGVSILVGTRDPGGRPEVARGVGASLAPGRDAMTLYLQQVWGARALANLRASRELAVTFSRPLDNLSVQLKGPCVRFLEPEEADRAVVERYHVSYSEQLLMVGLPRTLTGRIQVWPAAGVTFEIRDLFSQTPGPGAGGRLERGPAR